MSSSSSLPHLVFVYGTLKRGEPNHHWMQESDDDGRAEFVGSGRTETRYPLVIASKYNIPFLLNLPGTGKQVRGEVYRCPTCFFIRNVWIFF